RRRTPDIPCRPDHPHPRVAGGRRSLGATLGRVGSPVRGAAAPRRRRGPRRRRLARMDTIAAPTGRTIRKEVFIRSSQERVFQALTDPAELGCWLGHYAEVDLRPGGALRFSWPGGETDTGTVVAVEPPRRLVFAWGAPHLTEVEFLLVPQDDGTLLQ